LGGPDEAALADADTFHFTNACPQHKNLNQKEWSKPEDYVLGTTDNHDLKVSVFTGPVLRPDDRAYRGVQLPEEFWKVVVMARADTGRLSATGYRLTQKDMITGFEFVFGEFKTYQVNLRRIEELTGLDLGTLPEFDPLPRVHPGAIGLEVAGAESLVL
jgi:endonuclease G